jgi:hypothetical protein
LVEDYSVRTTSRITGVNTNTILNLLSLAGTRCEQLMEDRICGLHVKNIQCDELWGNVGMKEELRSGRSVPDGLHL